jgi:hypothetical protein
MTKQIHYDSPEAASIQTVTGWMSSTGQFWGKDEHMARYCGCTHMPCKTCGSTIEVHSYCRACADKRELEKFSAMEKQDWDGSGMLFHHETYFNELQEVLDYCMDNEIAPEELQLVICEPVFAGQIDPRDHYGDDLPEDGDMPKAIADAFDALNKVIHACGEPLSWSPGKTRVSDKTIEELTAQYLADTEKEATE